MMKSDWQLQYIYNAEKHLLVHIALRRCSHHQMLIAHRHFDDSIAEFQLLFRIVGDVADLDGFPPGHDYLVMFPFQAPKNMSIKGPFFRAFLN